MRPHMRTSLLHRIVMWAAGVVLGLSVAGLVACAFRGWWPLSPSGSSVYVGLDSGCLWMANVRPATSDGTPGSAVVGMDDPHWWWPGETGFVEMSSLIADEVVSPASGKLLWGVVLPLWMPATASGAVLVGLWVVGVHQRRRAMAGHCNRCGYDLSGIIGPCPECGREKEREA